MDPKTYLITLNAPPAGEGLARFAAVTIDDGTRETIAQCRRALEGLSCPGYGCIIRRGCVAAVVTPRVPECIEETAEHAYEDGPTEIHAGLVELFEYHELRTELIGLEIGPDWLSLVGYVKHDDFEFNGGLPENP